MIESKGVDKKNSDFYFSNRKNWL